MRKFIVILLIFSIAAFSSCSKDVVEDPGLDISLQSAGNPTQEPDPTNSQSEPTPLPTNMATEAPVTEDMIIPDDEIRIFIAKYKADFPTDETISNWRNYISDKCGVNINPIYFPRYSMVDVNMGKSEFIGYDIDKLEELSGLNGLVYVNDMSALKEMIDRSMVIPVNDIINEIPALNGIPDISYRQVSDSGDNIWAVPFTDRVFGNPRVYNKEWLEILDFEVPETLGEFHALAEAVATLDPDGNGKDDSYICETSIGSVLRDLEDVFRSFGIYLYAYTNVIMNPQSGEFEIPLLNKNFPEAVTLIKNMIDERYIYLKPPTESGDDKQLCASVLYLYEGEESYNGLDYGFFLKGSNEKQLAYVRSAPFTIAVLKNTEKPEVLLKAYVDMIVNNPDSRGDLGIGVKDLDYFVAGEFIYYYRYGENETISLPSYVPGAQYDVKHVVTLRDKSVTPDEEFFQSRKINLTYMEKIEPYYQSDIVYTYDINDNDDRLADINNMIRPYIDYVFESILIDGTPIETAVETFRARLGSLGILDLLEEINFEKADD